MSNERNEKNCAELIEAHMVSRLTDIDEMLRIYNGEIIADSEFDEQSIFEYGLSFDYVEKGTFNNQSKGYFRYQISWGGPSEEIRFYCSETEHFENDKSEYGYNDIPVECFADVGLYQIEFWYLDWYDGAAYRLCGNWKTIAEQFFSSLSYDGEGLRLPYLESTRD